MIRKLVALGSRRVPKPSLIAPRRSFSTQQAPESQFKDGLENMKRMINPSNDPRVRNLGLLALLTGGALTYYTLFYDNEISLGEALEDRRNDRVERVEIVSTRLFGQNKVFA